MIRPMPRPDWPDSWKRSFAYDEMEVFGGGRNVGYAYSYEERAIATLKLVREVSSAGARILDVAAAQV